MYFKQAWVKRIIGCFLALYVIPLSAASEKVQYQIEINQAVHHLAEITMLLPNIEQGHVDLLLPRWRPGKYKILPLANGIQNFQAKDSQGNRLKVIKQNTNSWRVLLKKDTKIEIRYQLYANELGNRTRHIDSTHAYLDAVASLLYSPSFRTTPVSVELDVPKGWRSVSGMKQGWNEHSFIAENYDVLADSPIETGKHQLKKFKVDGTPFQLAVWGAGNFSLEKMVTDLSSIAKAQKKYWGSFPFKSYLFIVHATNGERGATEHLNSTVIQRARWKFTGDDYLEFLDLASHELAHSWNVKSYRPTGLVPYDYQQENYTPLLWFVEGGSSYLDTLLLLRSELVDSEYFLKNLAKSLHGYKYHPGRLTMSAADASYAQWIATSGDRAYNSSVNIYPQGEMISLWLDFQLLLNSNGKISIQAIHQKLFQQYPANLKGFSERNVIKLLEEEGLTSMNKQWLNHIQGIEELPVFEMLESFGLRFAYKAESDSKKIIFTGIKLAKENSAFIERISKGSPAWNAGVTAGDELVAINGVRVTFKNIKALLKTFKHGQRVSLSFFRNDELQRTSMKLSSRPAGKPVLEFVKNASKKQIKLFETWLGIKYPEVN